MTAESASTKRRPRLAVIVANGITGDSRVQKTALAAARAGWDVTLIGAADGPRIKRTMMGSVEVVRVPVGTAMQQRYRGNRWRKHLTQFGMPRGKDAMADHKAAYTAWEREMTARMGWVLGDSPNASRKAARKTLGAVVRLRRAAHWFRIRAYNWENSRKLQPSGDWRRDWPRLVDLDLAFGPVIEAVQPDVIHANDITMIAVAGQSAARMRARGEKVAWIYDAHEYVRGVQWPKPTQARAFIQVEREYIGKADAVATVSPELAAMLQRDNHLRQAPLVVRNAPVREILGGDDSSIREVCGLAPDVPLMVYAGWIAAARGLRTAIEAMPKLPGVHLCLVTGKSNAELETMLQRAGELGVADRVHTAPYVPQHAVPDYLASADLGLICFQKVPNNEISLPTKLPEYLHAGLPIVSSDVKAVAAWLRENPVGEVYKADDVDAFADAVRRALDNHAQLKANISERMRADLSWEVQSDGLLRLYAKLSGRQPVAPRPDVEWSVLESPVAIAAPATSAGAAGPYGWRPLGNTRVRLGLGPANYAAQGAAFAGAISRAYKDVSVEVRMNKQPKFFGFPADLYVEAARLGDLHVQLDLVNRVLGGYTHVLADAFLPVFGLLNGDTIEGDLPALRKAGIKVAVLAHGSEIRHPGRHMQRYDYSLFFDAPPGMVAKLTAKAERNKRVADSIGIPLYVTTPDLLDDLPTAIWAPLVVDVDAWTCDRPLLAGPRPVVVHGPSNRWTKGTDRILPALTELHEQGVIELQLIEGVTPDRMRAMVQAADVVLDQFTTGSYGAFAVEAMSAGRAVVGTISDTVLKATGGTLPIVNASSADIRQVLLGLIEDPDGTRRLGADAAAYARENHDGRKTAAVLGDFLC